MTGEAYNQSAVIARDHGWPFPGYDKNRESFLEVVRMHRAAVEDIDSRLVPADMLRGARRSWTTPSAKVKRAVIGMHNPRLGADRLLVGNSLILTSRGLVRLQSLGNPHGKQWQPLDIEVSTTKCSQSDAVLCQWSGAHRDILRHHAVIVSREPPCIASKS